ncbi:hypothetical protein [Legionella sp.]|uniref:hypothetical protein n=1 Tax=Legionella sp. TaxID=459 RepID=UPI003C8C119C
MLNNNLTKKAILKSDTKNEFIHSKCVLTISVGQPPHESDKFRATLIALNNNFDFCIIMVCDSLQRHTMEIVSLLDKNEIHEQSNLLGDEWIMRNARFINQLTIPYEISRWDYWLNHEKYNTKSHIINQLYHSDEQFKKSVDDTTSDFLKRNTDKMVREYGDAFFLSKEYLLEECAVMLILAEEGYEFEIYPNQRNLALDYIYKEVISAYNENLMKAISIKFKNLTPNRVMELEKG